MTEFELLAAKKIAEITGDEQTLTMLKYIENLKAKLTTTTEELAKYKAVVVKLRDWFLYVENKGMINMMDDLFSKASLPIPESEENHG